MNSQPPADGFRRAMCTSFDVGNELYLDEDFFKFAKWQKERCPETNKEHYQIYVEARKPMRFRQWKRVLGDHFHIEEARKVRDACIKYCSKEETRVDGPWTFGEEQQNVGGRPATRESSIRVILQRIDEIGSEEYKKEDLISYSMYRREIHAYEALKRTEKTNARLKEEFGAAVLLQWHQRLLNVIDDLIATKDRRKIIWVWSIGGNKHKSWMAAYLRVMRGAVPLGGKLDAAQMIYNGEPLVTFDIPRAQYEFIGHFYTLAETLRNGEIVSSKYMSEVKIFDPPVIVFFANARPDYEKWSHDRVIEFNLNDDETL